MNQKRTNKVYSQEFKQEALALISEQGYSVAEATLALGLRRNSCIAGRKNTTSGKAAALSVWMSVAS